MAQKHYGLFGMHCCNGCFPGFCSLATLIDRRLPTLCFLALLTSSRLLDLVSRLISSFCHASHRPSCSVQPCQIMATKTRFPLPVTVSASSTACQTHQSRARLGALRPFLTSSFAPLAIPWTALCLQGPPSLNHNHACKYPSQNGSKDSRASFWPLHTPNSPSVSNSRRHQPSYNTTIITS
jgi:hypothetical protein